MLTEPTYNHLSGRVAGGAFAGLLALASVAACNGGSTGSNVAAPKGEIASQPARPALHGKLPQSIRSAGELNVVTDAAYPPMEFFKADNKTLTGFDIDLGTALSQVLGVRIRWTNAAFDTIIPSLEAGRFDFTITAVSDIPERRHEVTFVDYVSVGSTFLVRTGNPSRISDFMSLCGKKLGVQSATTQLIYAKKQQQKCDQAGKPRIAISTFKTNDQANLALRSQRVDTIYAQSVVNVHVVKQSRGQFEVAGGETDRHFLGIAIPKDQGQLIEAVRAGVQELIDNGAYRQIIDKWSLQGAAITTASINAAGK